MVLHDRISLGDHDIRGQNGLRAGRAQRRELRHRRLEIRRRFTREQPHQDQGINPVRGHDFLPFRASP